MFRFIIAAIVLVAALASLAAGIAQRTIWLPADHLTATATIPSDVRYTVVSGATLKSFEGQQDLKIRGENKILAVYGRQQDVTGWLDGTRYAEVRVNAEGKASVRIHTAPTLANITLDDVRNPSGSDLWYEQRNATGQLDWKLNLTEASSVLIAADGTERAPRQVSITWPRDPSTPYAIPLIVIGGSLGALGLVLYGWAIFMGVRAIRKDEDGDPHVKNSATAAKAGAATVLILAIAAAPLASSPRAEAATQDSVAASLTDAQARRIVADAVRVAAAGDKARSGNDLTTRFTGPALQMRESAYRLVAKTDADAMPSSLPTDASAVKILLPQATNDWPRTLFTVVAGDGNKTAPQTLMFTQSNPRGQYKITYVSSLQPNVPLPPLPGEQVGAARVVNDTKILQQQPGQLAANYGDLLLNAKSKSTKLFDSADDTLLAAAGPTAKKAAAKAIGSTADLTFKELPGSSGDAIALAATGGGAIVATSLQETWTVKPNRSGVTVKPSGATKALSGVKSTARGIKTTYSYQLLFYVPQSGSTKAKLLGYAQVLAGASELPKAKKK